MLRFSRRFIAKTLKISQDFAETSKFSSGEKDYTTTSFSRILFLVLISGLYFILMVFARVLIGTATTKFGAAEIDSPTGTLIARAFRFLAITLHKSDDGLGSRKLFHHLFYPFAIFPLPPTL